MLAILVALSAVSGTGAADPYSASATGSTVCASGPVVEGVDVSKYEGSIDWNAVKGAGIGFGIARISDGLNYPDATFDTNYAAMKSVGIVRGSYQYFEPAQDPVAQANMVLQHVGALGQGDLPPVIDVETMGGVSASAVMAAVDQWLSTVQAGTGRKPIVYVSPSFWDGLGDPTVAADLWIANWGVACPGVPAAFGGWQFWQYSATGTVPGIPVGAAADLDRFNGSTSDLLAYAGGGASTPPPPAATITAPANGATVSGTITVTASGNSSTVRIELYADAALLGTGGSASWDTTSVPDGSHTLTAKAFDSSGASTTSVAVAVTVSNSAACGATCTPPPVGCSTSSSGAAGVLSALLLALALRRRR